MTVQIIPQESSSLLPAKPLDRHGIVIKHRAAVQVSNTANLLGRQVWNVLLANAYSDLLRKETFSVSIKDLAEVLNFDRRNLKYLRDQIRKLVGCVVEWDLIDKTGDWEAYSMLSAAKIEKGNVLHYRYDRELKLKLYNPTTYAKISLAIQRRFKSRFSLALYELCVSFFIAKYGQGETPWIGIDDYRRLMDIHKDKHYDEFKYVNRAAIIAPIKEINEESDLQVEAAYRRLDRTKKITDVKFLIKPGSKTSNELLKKLKCIKQAAEQSQLPMGDDSIHDPLYERFLEYGFKDKQIEKFMQSYKDKRGYMSEILDLVDIKIRAGAISNITGYIVKALQNDYRPSESLKEKLERERVLETTKKNAAIAEEEAQRKACDRYYKYKEGKALEYAEFLAGDEKDCLITDFVGTLDLFERGMLGGGMETGAIYNTTMERPALKVKFVNFVVDAYLLDRILPFSKFTA